MDRPQHLFDREREWAALANLVQDDRPGLHLGVVWGRRRQGKTFLLRAVTAQTGGLYHQAQELERTQALALFAGDVAVRLGLPIGTLRFDNWDVAFRTALGYPARATTSPAAVTVGAEVLVVDELPYLLAHSPEIPSVLQDIWGDADSYGWPARCVVVCGSAMSVMSKLLSGAQPLRGRAQLDMTVQPFGYRLAADYWNISDPDLAFYVNAVLGGTAGYRPLIEHKPPASLAGIRGWLGRSVLNPAHALFSEKDYLLREDPRMNDKQLYNSILAAIAGGAHSATAIGGVVGRDHNALRHPLSMLVDAGFVTKSQDALTQKRPMYAIADPIVRFNEVVIAPFRTLLEQQDIAGAWEAAQPAFRSRVLGPHFEEMARDWAARHDAWPVPVGVVGATVLNDPAGKSQHEIDVVALERGAPAGAKGARVVVLGEAKSSETHRTLGDLTKLRRGQQLLVDRGVDAAGAVLALFGRGGFDANLVEAAAAEPAVRLVNLADMYR